MPRPDRSDERRRELLPILARAFADLGYRRATTAELAERCGAQEAVLYRLWPDKRAMFLAALDHVFERSRAVWSELAGREDEGPSAAERILAHEAVHHGEAGLYRILFAGLSETEDAEIAAALKRVYARFQELVQGEVESHRAGAVSPRGVEDPALAAWAIVGLGSIANVGRELGLLSADDRRRLFEEVGRTLLG